MTQKNQTFAELAKLRAEMKKLMEEKGKTAIMELFTGVFEKFPQVAAIQWQQWIPGFNDGDPCTFSVGETKIQFVDAEGDETDFLDSYEMDDEEIENKDDLLDALGKIDQLFQDNEDVLEGIFGSNAEITIKRGATEAEVDDSYDCGY
jgi:predicted SnoaL-like aldol condensation-catalyzing enzyme